MRTKNIAARLMSFVLSVRLKTSLRIPHVVLSSKIQQKTMPCALHTQHARSVFVKAQAARNMSATSVPGFLYKSFVAISINPQNSTHFKYQKRTSRIDVMEERRNLG